MYVRSPGREKAQSPLEQNIQTAAASKRSHDTSTDTTSCTARIPPIIGIVSLLLLLGISLLRRVIHRLLLLGVITLLLLVPLLRVVALLGLAAAVVVCCGAGAGTLGWRGIGVVGACVVDGRWVGGWWACLVPLAWIWVWVWIWVD